MHILLNDYGGYAFAIDLSTALARHGHQVTHVYTSASGSPQGDFAPRDEKVRVINIPISANPKNDFLRRWAAERSYGSQVAQLISEQMPDVVLAANTPLEALRLIFCSCHRNRIPFVLWWQDILSLAMESILSRRLGIVGRMIGRSYRRLEKYVLRHADAVIAVTPDFLDVLTSWKLTTHHVVVIPNWAPLEKLPVLPKENDFARRHDLLDKFVVLYAGTLGMKQNPQSLADAAKYLACDPAIRLVVISDGVGMSLLNREKERRRLDNLLLLPLQPFDQLPVVLATGDLHLVLLQPDAGRFCVPSKVWSSFCAARPLLLVIPPDNYAARVTTEIEAGVVVSTDDSKQLAETILRLKVDPIMREWFGSNGRRYAEKHFAVELITTRFESVLSSVVNNRRSLKGKIHAE
jgi:colanic acid biosynthesis glycosyl transferase WcaI